MSNLARARLNGSKKLVVSCVYLVMLMMNDNVVKMYHLLLFVPAKIFEGRKLSGQWLLAKNECMDVLLQCMDVNDELSPTHRVKLTTAGTATSGVIIPSSKA